MREGVVMTVLGYLGVENRIKPSGSDWIMVSCPLALTRHASGEDHKPSLSVRIGDGASAFLCHACGEKGGSLRWLVRAVVKEGLIDAVGAEQALQLIGLHEGQSGTSERWEVDEADDLKQAPTLDADVLNHLSTYSRYVRSRSFSERECLEWQLGFQRNVWWEAARAKVVLFPCVLPDGQIPFVQARRTDTKDFRYYPNGIIRQHVLGTHLLTSTVSRVIYAEGMFDAMRIRRALRRLGWLAEYGVVTGLGSKPNEAQIEHLFSYAEAELIIATDADPAGDQAAVRLYEMARWRGIRVTRLPLPAGMDPDQARTKHLMSAFPKRQDVFVERLRTQLSNLTHQTT